ncbi:C40 family peptidase [Paractinoplanes abujensis]|uniref:Cell wall-associated NlpC family hydrolase n=1 Tax=Paractinoplanes abujensis TaxID=882441 RepID=A0A7W7CUE4_9ACTN|nr:NlpC/P60 family protein [Actinoplanes abujensis]MBB4694872.1 cell wall-associated NlpC family hydrolase [Actinoplanes abujensis]
MAAAITGSFVTPAQAAPSATELKKQIEAASNKLEDVTEQYNAMRVNLKKTQDDAKKLQASLAPAQAALKAASTQVGNLATTSYKQGRVGPMSALLTGTQDGLMDRMSYLDMLTRANQRDIDTFTEATQNFSERQAALKATQTKQQGQLRALTAQKTAIQKDLKKLFAMREAAYGQPQETGGSYDGPIPEISGKAGIAVTYAYNQIGKPYLFGADGPGSFDCSGLTSAAWRAAGKSLTHQTKSQWSETKRISRDDLQPGDLVFYRSLGHVAIYVGDNQIIDAPHSGTVVKKRTINIMTPYGFGRVV